MGKRRMSAAAIVDKQISRAQQAVPDYIAGVQAVTESPNQKAADKVNKYQMGVNAAVANGTYVAANQAVGLDGWKAPTVSKGGARYAQGVADAKPKLLKFQNTYGPVRQGIADQV